MPVPDGRVEEARLANDNGVTKHDAYLAEKAKLDTLADDGKLAANLSMYEARLIDDAKAIIAHQKQHPELQLRPHYRNLVEAYQDEFVNNKGLRDEKIIQFFDRYVHDSLAGMASDATLPSDPRVVYIGGDTKLQFAKADDQKSTQTMAA